MSTGFAVRTVFELALAALLIFGLINEEKVADFEQRVFFAVKRAVRRKLRGRRVKRTSGKIVSLRDATDRTGA